MIYQTYLVFQIFDKNIRSSMKLNINIHVFDHYKHERKIKIRLCFVIQVLEYKRKANLFQNLKAFQHSKPCRKFTLKQIK